MGLLYGRGRNGLLFFYEYMGHLGVFGRTDGEAYRNITIY